MHLEKGKRKNGSKLKQVENHIKTTDVVHVFLLKGRKAFASLWYYQTKRIGPPETKTLQLRGALHFK